ncbi:MAG: TipAS antibiotic-recognition domain-containing protein, partial [Bacillota bacterium]|nr:TipAS antibiotic-recognition domain-containing protein [Bacillota bacterium]
EYFTSEEINKMKKHYSKLDSFEADKLADSWSHLISLLQSEMDMGTSPDNPGVIELVRMWKDGMDFFTGGDAGIINSAERFYTDNPHAAKGSGMSRELYKYIKDALSNIK